MRCRCRVLGLALLAAAAVAHAGGPESAYYADDTDGIFWFMHLSDSHLGAGWPEVNNGPVNLPWSLGEAREVIAPVFIVVTGDLVDGSAFGPTTGQSQGEWNDYREIYVNAGMTDGFYYDLVGNHDLYSFSCPSLDWYLDNSLQGQAIGEAHFSWGHTTVHGDYFFYGLNASGSCVDPFTEGDGRILNAEYDALREALEANSASHELTFVFAHQGPSQPLDSARVVDELVTHGAFYLHGHQHEYEEYLAGNLSGEIVVNQIDTLGKGDNNNVGVGAVDHNAFIYRATSTDEPWPLVVITAPVATSLRNGELNPYAYDVCKDRVNPVRALVFAPVTPTSVRLTVGSLPLVDMTQEGGGPIWTAAIDTSALAAGPQTVSVQASAVGRTASDAITAELYEGPCSEPSDGGVGDASHVDGTVVDGSVSDGGVADDAAPPADAAASDAPGGDDAAAPGDAGGVEAGFDGGAAVDAEVVVDGPQADVLLDGSGSDVAVATDASPDAAPPEDASPGGPDVGADAAGSDPGAGLDGGCGCRPSRPPGPWGACMLVGLLAVWWRRRRRSFGRSAQRRVDGA